MGLAAFVRLNGFPLALTPYSHFLVRTGNARPTIGRAFALVSQSGFTTDYQITFNAN